MNFVKKVARSFPSISPLPDQFLPHSISIFHHSASHSSISLTFNFPNHPLTLCPSNTLICLPQCISQPPLLVPLSVHIPLLSHSLIIFAIHLFFSLLCSAVRFYFPTFSLPSRWLSTASSCSVPHHRNCCRDLNSSGVACSDGTRLTTSCSRCVCMFKIPKTGTKQCADKVAKTHTHLFSNIPSV